MDNRTNRPQPTKQRDASKDSRTIDEKDMERVADEAAGRAKKEEEEYDSEHDIFTK